jgi:hypothetical protein
MQQHAGLRSLPAFERPSCLHVCRKGPHVENACHTRGIATATALPCGGERRPRLWACLSDLLRLGEVKCLMVRLEYTVVRHQFPFAKA